MVTPRIARPPTNASPGKHSTMDSELIILIVDAILQWEDGLGTPKDLAESLFEIVQRIGNH